METATKNLENDHVSILRLIEVIEHIAKSEDPDIEHLEEVVHIIRNFADGTHHAKEENMLFPLLVKKGFSMDNGPVAVMLMEHEQGRKFVRNTSEHIADFKNGNTGAMTYIRQNISAYADLLKSHIAKENNVLFRMADKYLTQDEQLTLLAEFTELDISGIKNINSAEYTRRIEDLAGFYL